MAGIPMQYLPARRSPFSWLLCEIGEYFLRLMPRNNHIQHECHVRYDKDAGVEGQG